MNPMVARILFLLVTAGGLIWSYLAVPYLKWGDAWTTSRLSWWFFKDRPFAAFLWGVVVIEVIRSGWIGQDVGVWWFIVLIIGVAGIGHFLWPLWMN